LGLLSLVLGFAIAGAILGIPGFGSGPGAFLAASYGLLAFAIPANLAYASFILADKEWRPDRVFFLSVNILPFLTLATGVSFVRDFEFRSGQFGLLAATGKTGFTFIVAVFTVFEALIIMALRILLFPKRQGEPGFLSKLAGGGGGGLFTPEGSLSGGLGDFIGNTSLYQHFGQWLHTRKEGRRPGWDRREEAGETSPVASPEASLGVPLPTSLAASPGMPPESEVARSAPELNAEAFLFSGKDSRLKDVYTKAAASPSGSIRYDDLPPTLRPAETEAPAGNADLREVSQTAENPDAEKARQDSGTGGAHREILSYINISLPEPKPLASLEAARVAERGNPAETQPGIDGEEGIEEPEDLEEFDELDDIEEADDPDGTGEPALAEEAAVEPPAKQPAKGRSVPASPPDSVPVNPRPAPKAKPPVKSRGTWKVPADILNQYPDGEYWIIDDATRAAAGTLRATLEEFKIQAEVTGIRKGPVITMFEILPAPGVKLSKIVNLQDNIALRLAASSVRIVAPIPGKHAVGIEVPNYKRNIVSFREIIEGELHREGKRENRGPEIPVVLGKDITGEAQTVDLATTPHLLIAGSTGSGKSVCVNTIILSILYQKSPADCRLILIDPKIVELKLYNDIPHLLTPVITEPKRAFQALQYCIFEMERRYACLDSLGVRDIKSYNRRIRERNIAAEHMPYIVVVIDEFADLMATTGKELESTVARLAAMSRAVGVHLVLATQRPSIDVITGLIKANIPSRIAFMVASKMDSRIIIDQVGAEKLLGKGDMLYAGIVDPFPVRIQGAFVSEEEVEKVVEYVKTLGEPDYIDDEIFYDDEEEDMSPGLFDEGEDPLYEKALEIVTQQGKASASYIQRRLKIGYNRAARLVELMEQHGVVGPAQGSRPRELLRAFN
jgi:S-DNA-T family DNA segregation ATPase FtsK/SpoIIIE